MRLQKFKDSSGRGLKLSDSDLAKYEQQTFTIKQQKEASCHHSRVWQLETGEGFCREM